MAAISWYVISGQSTPFFFVFGVALAGSVRKLEQSQCQVSVAGTIHGTLKNKTEEPFSLQDDE